MQISKVTYESKKYYGVYMTRRVIQVETPNGDSEMSYIFDSCLVAKVCRNAQ